MALNAGDMLYYDGTKWVNSSTMVTSISGLTLDFADTGTNNVPYALQLSHTTTNAGGAASGFGVGLQFVGQDSAGGTPAIGSIQCVETNSTANNVSSYISLNILLASVAEEVMRVRPVGAAPGQLWCRGDFFHNPGASGLLGFFGVGPVAQQSGGALTAGATYTANEQSMLNKVYAGMRAYGLLT